MASSGTITKDKFTLNEYSIVTTDKIHTLYVQEWGNPQGTPMLYLHGGPGSGCNDKAKLRFNPTQQRVIFIDQRGCGHSTPFGSLQENNTQKLVEDIEQIRKQLVIDSFVIVGASWGSTLALCYSITYPKRVTRLVLGGIFLGTKSEGDWINKGGYRDFFPEIWETFKTQTPPEYFDDPDAYHMPRINGNDETKAKQSVHAYTEVEYGLLTLDDRPKSNDYETFDPASSRIELHYITNQCFLEPNYIMANAGQLSMPVNIVQGRYDMICKPIYAYSLHKALADSTLQWTIAGHSSSDRANFDATKAILSTL